MGDRQTGVVETADRRPSACGRYRVVESVSGGGDGPSGGDVPGGDVPGGDVPGGDVPGGDVPGEDSTVGDASESGDDPLAVLLRVQDLDTEITRFQHRRLNLAERRELDIVEEKLAALAARVADLGTRQQELLARQAEMEEQVAGLTERRRALEERMYAARGSASRDLQAMDDEIHHLAQRRAEIEDVELAAMEEQEPVDAELARLAEESSQLETATGSLRAAVAAAEGVLAVELSTLESSRVLEAARLPNDLADRYELLRRRLGGVGAARLVGNRCEGCHLELPSAEVDRIRHQPPGTMVTCDQCGRILVRAATALSVGMGIAVPQGFKP